MPLIGNTAVTMADLAKRMDPNGMLAPVAELLNETNEVIPDIPWMEGNLPTGHRTTLRTALPTVYWRAFNEGVPKSKSNTAQVDEVCGMMEGYAEVDKELIKLYGNQGAAFRASEVAAFVEGMGQEFVDKLFYGSLALEPKAFTGLATRFADVNIGESGSALKDGAIIDAGGTQSDNTSIWLVVWGPNTVHGIYPRGMVGGLENEDLGQFTAADSNGGLYEVMRSHFMWKCGIAVRDWRFVVRIANIDTSNLIANTTPADLIKFMGRATRRVPNLTSGRPVFYVNRVVDGMLIEQALGKVSSTLTFDDVAGRPVTKLLGIPIRKVDAILNNEQQLT
jgi:hypothetical protein